MTSVLLTLNAGSSSIKFAAFSLGETALEQLASGQIEGLGATATFSVHASSGKKNQFVIDESRGKINHTAAVGAILDWLEDAHHDKRVIAVGHRVVHGGVDFMEPIIIEEKVLAKLKNLVPLAPLHQPHNISGIEAALHAFPGPFRSPASIRPFIAATHLSLTPSRCLVTFTTKAFGATVSTAFPMNS